MSLQKDFYQSLSSLVNNAIQEQKADGASKKQLLEYFFEDGKTLHEMFMRGVRISGNKPCCGWKISPNFSFTWITYNEVLERSVWVGSGLIALGAKPDPSQLIGILSENRIESVLVEQACNCYSMVTIPIIGINAEFYENIVRSCNLNIIIVDAISTAIDILNFGLDVIHSLKLVIAMGKLNDEIISLGKIYDIKVITFTSLEMIGKKNIKILVPPKPEDLRAIVFTSDTTDKPKGVMLTHKNVVALVSGIYDFQKAVEHKNFDDSLVYISYFPSSTAVELMGKSVVFCVGGRIGFFSGDRTKLFDFARELKPTLFPIPPQLVEHIQELVLSQLQQSFIKSILFKCAMKKKMKLLERGVITKQTIWDYFIFKRIRNMLGGNVKHFVLGGASVAIEKINLLRCALGAKVYVSYGSTETVACVSIADPFDLCPGSVGPPLPCSLVKLIDAPEQKFFVENGFGEICVKGANVFSGYYNDESLTNAVIDNDGWFHTGDIGTWLDNGRLKIIDRRKHFFVLSSGERITPERIESVFVEISVIHQIYVYGNENNDFIVAIVVPKQEVFEKWCEKKHLVGDHKSLCQNPEVENCILTEMNSFGQKHDLKVFEIPKKICLSDEYFSIENGLLTVSKKIKRYDIYVRFKKEIESAFE